MKNLILTALLTAIIGSSAFATGENKISLLILNSFKSDFKDATNVVWTSKTGLAEASFRQNSRRIDVFYNSNGTVFAVSKTIDLDELPVAAKRAFAKRYEGYTVKEAIKYESPEEYSYFLSAENENVVIKVGEDERLSIFKKNKK